MYMWGNRIMIWIITIQITQSWGCLIIQPKPSNSCLLLTLFYSSLGAEVAHLAELQQPLLRTTSRWRDTITVYPPVWLKLETIDRCQNTFVSCEGCLNWEEGIFSGDRNVLYGVDVVTQGNTGDLWTTWAWTLWVDLHVDFFSMSYVYKGPLCCYL